jgi:integrase
MRVYRSMTYGQRQKPIEILTEDEVWALIRACSRRAPSGRRDACLIALCAFAGLRTAEALALLPTQIRKNGDDSLEVVDLIGKGGVRRTVHVLPGREKPILDWLDARRRLDLPKRIQVGGRRVAPPLICSISMPDPGHPLDGSNTRKMLKRRAAAAGIEKRVHMHGLRHFHAFQLAQRGVKLHIVQQQLGHSRLDTTSTYIAHLSAKEIGDEIRRAFSRPA